MDSILSVQNENLERRRKGVFENSSSRRKSQESFALTTRWNLAKPDDVSWINRTWTPHPSETNGIAERALRRMKEGTSALLLPSGLDEKWWADSMECYCYLGNVQDLLSDGKTPYERHFGKTIQWDNNSFRSMPEYHPISSNDQSRFHQIGEKVLPRIITGYTTTTVQLGTARESRRARLGGSAFARHSRTRPGQWSWRNWAGLRGPFRKSRSATGPNPCWRLRRWRLSPSSSNSRSLSVASWAAPGYSCWTTQRQGSACVENRKLNILTLQPSKIRRSGQLLKEASKAREGFCCQPLVHKFFLFHTRQQRKTSQATEKDESSSSPATLQQHIITQHCRRSATMVECVLWWRGCNCMCVFGLRLDEV